MTEGFLARAGPVATDGRFRVRPAARTVAVAPDAAVLMVCADFHGRDVWFTPGGGVAPGEEPADAAIRELAEETGVDVPRVGPVVLRRIGRFNFLGDLVEAWETYYLARVPERVVARPRRLEHYEQETFHRIEWLALDEMRALTDPVYPRCLPELVEAAAAGAVSEPWEEIDLHDDAARAIVAR